MSLFVLFYWMKLFYLGIKENIISNNICNTLQVESTADTTTNMSPTTAVTPTSTSPPKSTLNYWISRYNPSCSYNKYTSKFTVISSSTRTVMSSPNIIMSPSSKTATTVRWVGLTCYTLLHCNFTGLWMHCSLLLYKLVNAIELSVYCIPVCHRVISLLNTCMS